MKQIYLLLLISCLNIVVNAQTNFYSKSSGNLDQLSTWGTNTDGSGTAPANFTTASHVFNIRNTANATIGGVWGVSGTGSKIVVGDGTNNCNFTIPPSYSVTGTVDVAAKAILTIQNSTNPTLGTLNATSTVDYDGTGSQIIAAATYGNLRLSNARTGNPVITLASGTIRVPGSFSTTYTGAVTFVNTGNTFVYSTLTGGSVIGSVAYNNLTLSNTTGADTAGGNITVNGTLTTSSGGTMDMSVYTLSGASAVITNNGTVKTSSVNNPAIPAGKDWTGAIGTVQFAAVTGGQYIPQGTFKNLTLSNTSGNNTVVGNLTVNTLLTTTAGGVLNMATYALNGALTTLTNNGTIQTQNTSATPFSSGRVWGGTGTVEYNGTDGQTIVLGTYVNLKISGARNTGTVIAFPSGTLTIKGDLLATYTGTVAFADSGNTVTFSTLTGGHVVAGITYNNLVIGNTTGTNTAGGNITIAGTLSTSSGGIFDMSVYDLAGSFTLTNNGTISTVSTSAQPIPSGLSWTGSTGLVKFASVTGGQIIPAGTYKTLTVSNTSGTNTASGNLTVTGTLTTTAGGILDMSVYALNETGAPVNGGTIETQNASNAPLPTGKIWTGTVMYYTSIGGQTVMKGTYNNLTLNNTSGTNTASGGLTVNGTLTTTAGGTLDMTAAYTLILGTASTIIHNGTIKTSVPTTTSSAPIAAAKNWGSGTIIYSAAAGAQTIVAGTYSNLILNNTSGTNTAGALTVNGTLTTTAGGILNMGTNQLAGTFVPVNNGTIQTQNTSSTPLPAGLNWGGSGSVQYNRAPGGQIIASGTYNNLLVSNTSGTDTAGGNIAVNNTLTTTSGGTLDMQTNNLTGNFTPVNNGSIKTSSLNNPSIPQGHDWTGSVGAVIYGALTGGQTVVQGTYKNLTLANTSGTSTASGSITVNGILTTTAGGTFNLDTFALNGSVTTLTNNGTVQTQNTSALPFPTGKTWTGTGTVEYNGSGSQTIVLGTYVNLKLSGTRTGTPAITLPSGTITISGSFPVTYTGAVTFANTGNTVVYSALTGAHMVGGITYGSLKLSNTSGIDTANGNVVVNGTLTTTSGGTFDLSTYTLSGPFAVVNNGTIKTSSTNNPAIPNGLSWSGTTGAVIYAATSGGQTVAQGTYNRLTVSNTSGTDTASGNLSVTTAFVTTAGGTLNMGTYALAGAFAPTNNGTLQTQNTSSLPIPTGKAWGGTVEYNGNSSQTIVAVTSYVNLTLSGARANSPVITLGTGTNTITVSGNFKATYTGAVTFANTTNTFAYSSTTGGQSVGSIQYHILRFNNTSGTDTAAGDLPVSTTLITTAGGTLDMGTFALTGAFTPTNSGTIVTQNTSAAPIPSGKTWAGTINYNAVAGGQTVVAATAYNNLTIGNTSGTNTASGNMTVNGTLTTSGGILDMQSYTLAGTLTAISGMGIIRTANVSAAAIKLSKIWPQSIEYYNATGGQTIVAGTYSGGLTNSNTSGTNAIAAGAAIIVSGNLTLNAGSTLNDNGVAIALNGNIAGTGTHTGTGSISMNSSGGTISAATLNNIKLNNAGGFSLTGSPTVNGMLTLAAGNLVIGTYNLVLGAAATIAGAPSSSNMIVANNSGQVRKKFTASGSFIYPIGDNTPNYSPVAFMFSGGTISGGAYAGFNVTNTKHPLNASPTDYINRYWSAALSGINNAVYTVAATYVPADVVGSEANVTMAEYSSTLPWTVFHATNASTHTITATNVSANTADFTGIIGGPVVTASPATASLCAGDHASVTATGTGYPSFTYTWAPSAGLSTTRGATVIATPTVTTTYTVTLTDGNGLTATATSAITVVPVPSVTVTASATGNVCTGTTEILTATGSGGTGTAVYTWSGPGISSTVTSGSAATYTVVPYPYNVIPAAAAGAYTVSLSFVGNSCGTAIATTPVITPVVHQWQGGASGAATNWNNAGNWLCGGIPLVSDNILIPAGANNPVILAGDSGLVNNLFIDSGVVVTLNDNSTLNIKGDLQNKGSITGTSLSNAVLNGSSTQIVSGVGSIYNLQLNNSAGASIRTTADTLSIKGALTLTSGTLVTNNALMLCSDSSGTARIAAITGGAITGNVTMQQYIQGGRRAYRFLGHPFTTSIPLSQLEQYVDISGPGGSDSGFTSTTNNAPSSFWYNAMYANSSMSSDPGWRSFTSPSAYIDSNQFKRYEGIRLFVRGAKGEGLFGETYTPSPVTIRTCGAVNTDAQNITMVKGSGANQDYNLIANPYPSPVDIGTVIKKAYDSGKINGTAFYVWNPYMSSQGAFQAIPIDGTPYFIEANASFELRTMANGNTLNFTEANKSAGNTTTLLKSAPQFLTLNVYDASYHLWDMLYLKFNEQATDQEDIRYDAAKPTGPSSLSFYSLSADDSKLSIDSRPYADGKTIALGISTGFMQEFIIKVDNIVVPGSGKMYLHDKYLKQYVLLEQGTEYAFNITADSLSQGDQRFELVMGKIPAITTQENASTDNSLKMQLMPNPATNEVTLNYTLSENNKVDMTILNIEGVTVLSQYLGTAKNGKTSIDLSQFSAGIYMVVISSGNERITERLIKE